MDDTAFSSYPIPFANVGRQKRLFNPPSDEFNNVDTSTPEADKLSQYLQNVPNRESYAPGTKRRILSALVAGLSAAGGESVGRSIGIGKEIQDDPYNEAISDWKLRGAGLERAAQIEGQRINTRMHAAEYRNKYNFDIANLQEKQNESENKNQNAALDRQQRGQHWEDQNTHWSNQEQNLADYRKGELAARAARTNAIRERTTMMGNRSTGSQVSKLHNMANESHAMTSALADVLSQSPQAKGLFEDDGKGGHVPVPKTAIVIDPVKGITRPLNRNELTAQQTIMQHVRERAQAFLTQGLMSQGEAPGTILDNSDETDDSEQ